tara:strand:+ start:10954 stop:11847 length:894 start_codon:yes stop_codon:yes gene_type:complete
MNVLSLFNGMSTGHTALNNIGIKVDKYYSSEIKPAALKITNYHYPNTIQLGDINNWKEWNIDWKEIDMVLSGSPCQDLSQAGKISYKHQKGLKGKRSNLFFLFVDILNYIKKINPNVLFLQENVGSAPKKDVGIMSRALGVYPVRINSKLVTAQLRDRYYWSNIKTCNDGLFDDIKTDIPQPKDRKIILGNILTSGKVDRDKHICLLEGYIRKNIFNTDKESWEKYIKNRPNGMATTIQEKDKIRLVNKVEMCRLQGFPDDWCDMLSYKEACSVLGDGWTLPIIEHIFSFIKKNKCD